MSDAPQPTTLESLLLERVLLLARQQGARGVDTTRVLAVVRSALQAEGAPGGEPADVDPGATLSAPGLAFGGDPVSVQLAKRVEYALRLGLECALEGVYLIEPVRVPSVLVVRDSGGTLGAADAGATLGMTLASTLASGSTLQAAGGAEPQRGRDLLVLAQSGAFEEIWSEAAGHAATLGADITFAAETRKSDTTMAELAGNTLDAGGATIAAPENGRPTRPRVDILKLPAGMTELDSAQRTLPAAGGAAGFAQPATADDLVGKVIKAKYRVLRKIATGGFGSVYEARDENLGNRVAIKVLHPSVARRSSSLEEFRNEARRLTRLEHQNIVSWKVFDQSDDGMFFFVMELLEGEELKALLQREKKLDPKRASRMLLQTLDALRAAHHTRDGEEILHLDLKPKNIILIKGPHGEPDWVKLIDFGIGRSKNRGTTDPKDAGAASEAKSQDKVLDEGTGSSRQFATLTGITPEYAAPEHCALWKRRPDAPELDARADLFSLGVIAFEMLSGELPFERLASKDAMIVARIDTPAAKLRAVAPEVPRKLADFVDRCLERDREKRFADAAEAYAALHRIANPSRLGWVLAGSAVVVLAAAAAAYSFANKAGAMSGTLVLYRQGADAARGAKLEADGILCFSESVTEIPLQWDVSAQNSDELRSALSSTTATVRLRAGGEPNAEAADAVLAAETGLRAEVREQSIVLRRPENWVGSQSVELTLESESAETLAQASISLRCAFLDSPEKHALRFGYGTAALPEHVRLKGSFDALNVFVEGREPDVLAKRGRASIAPVAAAAAAERQLPAVEIPLQLNPNSAGGAARFDPLWTPESKQLLADGQTLRIAASIEDLAGQAYAWTQTIEYVESDPSVSLKVRDTAYEPGPTTSIPLIVDDFNATTQLPIELHTDRPVAAVEFQIGGRTIAGRALTAASGAQGVDWAIDAAEALQPAIAAFDPSKNSPVYISASIQDQLGAQAGALPPELSYRVSKALGLFTLTPKLGLTLQTTGGTPLGTSREAPYFTNQAAFVVQLHNSSPHSLTASVALQGRDPVQAPGAARADAPKLEIGQGVASAPLPLALSEGLNEIQVQARYSASGEADWKPFAFFVYLDTQAPSFELPAGSAIRLMKGASDPAALPLGVRDQSLTDGFALAYTARVSGGAQDVALRDAIHDGELRLAASDLLAAVAADGDYAIEFTATDRAGNRSSAGIKVPLHISARGPVVELLSPNWNKKGDSGRVWDREAAGAALVASITEPNSIRQVVARVSLQRGGPAVEFALKPPASEPEVGRPISFRSDVPLDSKWANEYGVLTLEIVDGDGQSWEAGAYTGRFGALQFSRPTRIAVYRADDHASLGTMRLVTWPKGAWVFEEQYRVPGSPEVKWYVNLDEHEDFYIDEQPATEAAIRAVMGEPAAASAGLSLAACIDYAARTGRYLASYPEMEAALDTRPELWTASVECELTRTPGFNRSLKYSDALEVRRVLLAWDGSWDTPAGDGWRILKDAVKSPAKEHLYWAVTGPSKKADGEHRHDGVWCTPDGRPKAQTGTAGKAPERIGFRCVVPAIAVEGLLLGSAPRGPVVYELPEAK